MLPQKADQKPVTVDTNGADENMQGTVHETKFPGTQRRMNARHLMIVALGGSVGTGLFVSSGRTLARGGPVLTFAGYALVALMNWIFMTILVEMVSYLPIDGGTPNYFITRYLSNSFGFAMGWTYWYAYMILVPYEIVAGSLVIDYWKPPIDNAVFITILIVVIVALNYMPVGSYGTAEFLFSSFKVMLVIGFMILSVVLVSGGGPTGDKIGSRYWHDPGPANEWLIGGSAGQFVAFLGVLIGCALPFSFGVEMVATCSTETRNPRKSLTQAAKAFTFRLCILYTLSIFFVTLVTRSDDPALTAGGAGAGASPYTIGIKNAGVKILDHIMNAVILLSAWSAGNVFLLLGSRALYSMAIDGNAPKCFAIVNSKGNPYWSVTVTAIFTLLAYLTVGTDAGVVFDWLVNMINMAAYFSWVVLSVTYLRWRKALEVQGVQRSALTSYKSVCGKWGAWACVVFFTLVGFINGFNVFFPGHWSVSDFMTAYVGIMMFILLYFGHKLTAGRNDPWVIPVDLIDITTGLDEMDHAEAIDEETNTGTQPLKTLKNRVHKVFRGEKE